MSANWSFLVSKQATGTSPPNVALEPVDFDQVLKLMLLCALATVGTVGNVFAISAVLLETSLKTRGNVFVVNLALAALLVSALAIPASAVVILAGVPQDKGACNFRWAAAVLSCHVSVLSLMFTALESHARFTSAPSHGPLFGHWASLTAALLFTWAAPVACVACQFLLCLGPDYCELSFRGNLVFLLTTGSLLICAPIALALASYARTLAVVRSSGPLGPCHDHAPPPQEPAPHRRPNNASSSNTPMMQLPSPSTVSVSSRDVERLRANMAVFAAFLATWLPLGIALAVGSVSPISGSVFDGLAWLALSNSCIQGFIYAIGDRHFRKIYRKLFHYCCCKTSVSFARRNRHDCAPSSSLVCAASADSCSSGHHTSSSGLHRYHSAASGQGEASSTAPAPAVRVHIIPGYNIYAASQQRRLAQAAATTVSHSQHQGNNGVGGSASISAPSGGRAKRDDGKRMCAYYNASGGCVVTNAAQRNPYEL